MPTLKKIKLNENETISVGKDLVIWLEIRFAPAGEKPLCQVHQLNKSQARRIAEGLLKALGDE